MLNHVLISDPGVHTKNHIHGRLLLQFKEYYNRDVVQRGLGDAIPDPRLPKTARKIASLDNYRWKFCCRGLYPLPIAA